ncbi:class I SAM-dependent methyltransferase [Streptomyces sp. NPDC050619]|uniref:SAM-dependent methyltransferase n=1 Tax=Streptomyces sp. NPDC050619 TaxID=3157214 RepID=UPI003432F9D6
MGSPGDTAELTEFFTRVLGGEWHLYSSHILGHESETENQQAKLDLLADLMHLRPGARVLDIGCGWGGSLTYLATRYGVTGVGISLVPQQCAYADRRAQKHGVPLEFRPSHWQDFETGEPFDAVMTTGVVVHFPSLLDYFVRARQWLRPGGILLNEEMHLLSADASVSRASRALAALDDVRKKGREAGGRLVVDEEGNYVTLDQETELLRKAGFEVGRVVPLSMADYQKTVEGWVANCERREAELTELAGRDVYRWYRLYFRLFRRLIDERAMQLDVVTARVPNDGP